MKKNKKEIKPSTGYYGYEKTFMQFQTALNKCETQSEIKSFEKSSEEFKEQGAPEELVDYLNVSIKNKMIAMAKKDNLDLAKLRAISKEF